MLEGIFFSVLVHQTNHLKYLLYMQQLKNIVVCSRFSITDSKISYLTSIQLEESVVRREHLIFYSKVLTRGTVTSVKCLPVTYLCTTYYIHNTFHLAIAKNKKKWFGMHPNKKKTLKCTAANYTKLYFPSTINIWSPFEWVPSQLSRFLTDPTLAKLLEHPGQY